MIVPPNNHPQITQITQTGMNLRNLWMVLLLYVEPGRHPHILDRKHQPQD
jgi:hypothetical protein